MINQFRTGYTYSLTFDFYNDTGDRVDVANPLADVFTPLRNKYLSNVNLSAGITTGRYTYNLAVPSGLTPGHWFGIASGITGNSLVVFSEPFPFEVVDIPNEPFWISLNEYRDYIEADDTDHTRDKFYKQVLQASMELIEAYTKRSFGQRQYDEVIEIKSTTRVKLKQYPVQSIVGLTPTSQIIPRSRDVLEEVITSEPTSFFFRLDGDNGILKLTDSAGFEYEYDGILLGIAYIAGLATIPEPIRTAALQLTSMLCNLATSEGIESIRLSDLSFALDRKLFDGTVGDALRLYRKIEIG